MRHGTAAAVLVLVIGTCVGSACSDDGDDSSSTTPATAPEVTICDPGSAVSQSDDELPQVDQIDEAIAAVTAELGAPPEFFEINATARVVNLFVAVSDATAVQTWAYTNGVLAAQEVRDAEGGTFVADQVDFDPDLVLEPVRGEIPEAVLETFYIQGDSEGNVRYAILASTACGGGFDIVVAPDGAVQAVDLA